MRKKKVDDVTISLAQFKKLIRAERKLKKYQIDGYVIAEMIYTLGAVNDGMFAPPTHLILEPDKFNSDKEKVCMASNVVAKGRKVRAFILKLKHNE